jgi:peptidoglycan/xylan/chitin deacetylase (PgdA/CDA1 family)
MKSNKLSLIIFVLTIILGFSVVASAEDSKGEVNVHRVALTFDDGPSPIYTPRILNVLKKNNVKATFFVLGKCVKLFPDVLRRIYADGHLIGNHTYHHKRLTTISPKEIEKEVRDTEKLIKEVICENNPNCDFEPPKFMRPPYGAKNAKVKEVVKSMGYKLVLWNTGSDDCYIVNHKLGFHKIVETIFSQKRRYKEIVLMHDSGGNRTYDVQALSYIIQEYKKRNYEFVTVDEFYK